MKFIRLKRGIKNFYYKLFGRILYCLEMRKRKSINNERVEYKLVVEFRELEKALRQIKYPKNRFNKLMSMILTDINLFDQIVKNYRHHRKFLKQKMFDERFYNSLNPNARSYPSHPAEKYINNSIKIDAQSLFIFGTILVNRSLLLLKMYFSDRHNSGRRSMYSGIGYFYPSLSKNTTLSPLLEKFKTKHSLKIKWLYSALRFYRNEFIEHLDRDYDQGMTFGIYNDGFSLSSYKWNYNDNDNVKIQELRSKLEEINVHIQGRDYGERNLINRYYLQMVFDNITRIPDDFLEETLKLVEEVGGESPEPNVVINQIETYIVGLFQFMIDELESSELAKYKKS